MSILFKGNLEEGNYTLIKSTDGWVLKGETAYVGFNFVDRPSGEWIKTVNGNGWNEWGVLKCSLCGATIEDKQNHSWEYNFCPSCGAAMRQNL